MHRMAGFVLIACLVSYAGLEGESGRAGEPPGMGSSSGRSPAERDAFRSRVWPLLEKYCLTCHGPAQPKAGLDLSVMRDGATARTRRRVWDRVREYLESGLMPPEDRAQPSRDEVAGLIAWIRSDGRADLG